MIKFFSSIFLFFFPFFSSSGLFWDFFCKRLLLSSRSESSDGKQTVSLCALSQIAFSAR